MRGQMELWMLTKFGLIFFIVALAAIVFLFEVQARSKICSDQTRAITDAVTGRIAQVLNSPVEDERRVYAFPLALVLGRNDLTRYTVDLTLFHSAGTGGYFQTMGSGKIIVNASPAGEPGCEAGSSIPFTNFIVMLNPSSARSLDPQAVGTPSNRIVMHFSPSTLTGTEPSKYLIIIKCGNKNNPPGSPSFKRFLLFQDCSHDDVNQCEALAKHLPDTPQASLDTTDLCGFP